MFKFNLAILAPSEESHGKKTNRTFWVLDVLKKKSQPRTSAKSKHYAATWLSIWGDQAPHVKTIFAWNDGSKFMRFVAPRHSFRDRFEKKFSFIGTTTSTSTEGKELSSINQIRANIFPQSVRDMYNGFRLFIPDHAISVTSVTTHWYRLATNSAEHMNERC